MDWKKSRVYCSVLGCGKNEIPIFHFPNPRFHLHRFHQWLQAAANPKYQSISHDEIYRRGFICWLHFDENQFVPGTKKLVRTAVPTLNLPNVRSAETFSTEINLCINPDNYETQLIENIDFSKFPMIDQPLNNSPRKRLSPSEGLNMNTDEITEVYTQDGDGADARNNIPNDNTSPVQCSFNNTSKKRKMIDSPGHSKKTMEPNRVSLLKRMGLNSKKIVNETEKKLFREAKRLQAKVSRLLRQKNCIKHSVKVAQNISKSQKLKQLFEGMTPVQQRFIESQIRNQNCKPKGRKFTFEEKADFIALWKSGPKTYRLLRKMHISVTFHDDFCMKL